MNRCGPVQWLGSCAGRQPGPLSGFSLPWTRNRLRANRLALMRLLGKIGPGGLPAARQRLQHKEWYVVRNACKLLGELKGPGIARVSRSGLEHQDERVKKAAFQAVMESKLPDGPHYRECASATLSAAMEGALSNSCIKPTRRAFRGLRQIFYSSSAKRGNSDKVLHMVINVIASIPQEQAAQFALQNFLRGKH